MDANRKRYLIASALFEYVSNEAGKPFELQHHNDVEEIRLILDAEYSDLIETLARRKAISHANLVRTIKPVTD